MKIKHVLASSKDKKCTILATEMKKVDSELNDIINLFYPLHNFVISYHKSRDGRTYYADNKFQPTAQMPMIGAPVFHEVELSSTHQLNVFGDNNLGINPIEMNLQNEFEPIRIWASDKGIYTKGDTKTQFIKLMEESGELAKAILKKDQEEFIDAIGDCVVVLTNLAELGGVKIEDCINSAYSVIAKRTGKMENGTFVKNS
jgi:NTP pyrophosphatase (non-canonical NTP hydrolase)